MNRMQRKGKTLFTLLATSTLLLATAGCHSYWIDTTVLNQSGQTVREFEVDYPTASFGTNSLTPGAVMHYRFQIRGSGPVKVQYTAENGKTVKAQGLNLIERQQGSLTLRLEPMGKVEFLPNLQPAS